MIEAMKRLVSAVEEIPEEVEGWIPDELTDALLDARKAIAQAEKQERFFCERCGKRLSGGIHTCTPPVEAENQEPVAWSWRAFDPDDGHFGKWGTWHITDYKPPRQQSRWFQVVPLPNTIPPAAQREWVGLTDEEVTALKHNGKRYISSQEFARAIEAKLKEKNT